MNIEVCVDADRDPSASARAAFVGGAHTIELCAAMNEDGLTPTIHQVTRARRAFEKPGLIVILRPRSGGFYYTSDEIDTTLDRIPEMRQTGVDGVSFGFLTENSAIDHDATERLIQTCRDCHLTTTFHRAFDAVADTDAALDSLIDLGVDRVLTSGTPWGTSRTAVDGLESIRRTIERSEDRIEVVIAGGVSAHTIPIVRAAIPKDAERVSFHAYTGALRDGATSVESVRDLVNAASS